ncbi:uncharacterized protein BX663DRAFT_255852 [Cokeromyces recurvatus]|uniref:uncharacterized protein n=1 Tax=Cokeromyces recurvatus TaxID=90255 RepID=UPI00221FEF32|nr:uncharacterized protein BX663DRAFT_255852 [Cokeromyces recurvatus]KAI7906209.1 hypothetical protein BX663DRAFT_255852 [Cokeromyces recurvatus]
MTFIMNDLTLTIYNRVPPPTPPLHEQNSTTRTSSLLPTYHFERESLIDPTSNSFYNDFNTKNETFTESKMSNLIIDPYFYEPLPKIQTVQAPKSVTVAHIQHEYLDIPQSSPTITVQQVPPIIASKSNNKLPKPPLTPLVIPSTPSIHSNHTPTRTSSRYHYLSPTNLNTPGFSYSPLSSTGLSPSTPSPNTPSPSSLPQHKVSKRTLSIQPEEEAEQLIQQGIKYHEAGQLEKATDMFRRGALMDLPIAMFLYGVSLRHGWGCKKNEHLAFQYLQKAAEHAVEDLSHTVNTSAAKGELIMAIYELGVSFFHGWGCKKNKETAVYYFKIAADLNDPDAQNDLGHCYYHGHGVKKNVYLAAKYYRMADKQGQGIMGNSWIWKSKYDPKK